MKKAFKILSIVAVVVILILALFICGMFAIEGIEALIKRNERINKSTTLSKYIEYHGSEYTGSTDTALNFYAEDLKCDLLKDKDILYYDNDILVLDDYTIYETAFKSDKTYSNGQQYKQIETDINFKRIQIHYFSVYFVCTDNKYYFYNTETKLLEEVKNDRSNLFTITLLKDETISKLISRNYNDSEGTTDYIILKNDGKIYIQQYENDEILISESIFLSNEHYGHITDAVYSKSLWNIVTSKDIELPKQELILIVSDKGLYYLKETNEQQYIDTEPTYEMVESDIYNKYKNDIKYMNWEYIFTTDNNITWTSMLCRDIDPEVK